MGLSVFVAAVPNVFVETEKRNNSFQQALCALYKNFGTAGYT